MLSFSQKRQRHFGVYISLTISAAPNGHVFAASDEPILHPELARGAWVTVRVKAARRASLSLPQYPIAAPRSPAAVRLATGITTSVMLFAAVTFLPCVCLKEAIATACTPAATCTAFTVAAVVVKIVAFLIQIENAVATACWDRIGLGETNRTAPIAIDHVAIVTFLDWRELLDHAIAARARDKREYTDGSTAANTLTAELFDYAALTRQEAKDLDGLGGFETSLVDEAETLARQCANTRQNRYHPRTRVEHSTCGPWSQFGTRLEMTTATRDESDTLGPASSTNYKIDATEVTRAQYAVWLATSPALPPSTDANCGWNTSYTPDSTCMASSFVCRNNCTQHPQVCVDWCDASAYCAGVGKRLCGAISGGSNSFTNFKDPSLSQWHWACTSGGQYLSTYGNTPDDTKCNDYGYWGTNYDNATTLPVGSIPSCQSPLPQYAGIYDLNGNVWEWEDSCDAAGQTGNCHTRGVGFWYYAEISGCAADSATFRYESGSGIGFRCCSQ